MTNGGQLRTITVAILMGLPLMASKADPAQCGSTAAGFEGGRGSSPMRARGKGVSASTLAALMAANYATATIAADRNQGSMHLSLDQFSRQARRFGHRRARSRTQAIQCGAVRLHPATLRRAAGAAAGDLGNGDGLREVARESEHAVGRGDARL